MRARGARIASDTSPLHWLAAAVRTLSDRVTALEERSHTVGASPGADALDIWYNLDGLNSSDDSTLPSAEEAVATLASAASASMDEANAIREAESAILANESGDLMINIAAIGANEDKVSTLPSVDEAVATLAGAREALKTARLDSSAAEAAMGEATALANGRSACIAGKHEPLQEQV